MPRPRRSCRSSSWLPTTCPATRSRIAAWRVCFLVIAPPGGWPNQSSAAAPGKPALTVSRCMIMHYSVNPIPVGILGASGYAGRELCALVARHPRFSLVFATANEQRGQIVHVGGKDLTFAASDDVSLSQAAVVF